MKLRIKGKLYEIPTRETITARQSVQIAQPIAAGGFGMPPAGLLAAYDVDDPAHPAAMLAYCWLALSNAPADERVVHPEAVWDLAYGDYGWHLTDEEKAELERAAAAEAEVAERPTGPADGPESETVPPGSTTSTGS